MITPNSNLKVSSGGIRKSYLYYLIFVAGMGGLLAGIDYGIIAGALLYLDKTIPMSPAQQGFMVSIYVFGGLIASLFAGLLADAIGRKKMMLVGGLMFVVSIGLIFISSGYVALLLGRVLMGLSGGVVCVVVPLYMAECLPAGLRGRGTSVFNCCSRSALCSRPSSPRILLMCTKPQSKQHWATPKKFLPPMMPRGVTSS